MYQLHLCPRMVEGEVSTSSRRHLCRGQLKPVHARGVEAERPLALLQPPLRIMSEKNALASPKGGPRLRAAAVTLEPAAVAGAHVAHVHHGVRGLVVKGGGGGEQAGVHDEAEGAEEDIRQTREPVDVERGEARDPLPGVGQLAAVLAQAMESLQLAVTGSCLRGASGARTLRAAWSWLPRTQRKLFSRQKATVAALWGPLLHTSPTRTTDVRPSA